MDRTIELFKWLLTWGEGFTPRLVRSIAYLYLTWVIGSQYNAGMVEAMGLGAGVAEQTAAGIENVNALLASVWTLMTEWYFKDRKEAGPPV